MLKDVKWAEDGTYRPGDYHSPELFFNDGLNNSTEFDLQLGYFSSAAISVLAESFASFITHEGRMRLVINHIVSQEDKAAITKGMMGEAIDAVDLSNFDTLRQTFDAYQEQFFNCLAYLIQQRRIDIRIVKPKESDGIAHTKCGQFRDGDSVTSFTGSANFTINGFFNNLEEIKIDRSDTTDEMARNRIISQAENFEMIMDYRCKSIVYLNPDNLVAAIASAYGNKDEDELLNAEQRLKELKRKRLNKKHYFEVADDDDCQPHFPFSSGPREYQKEAFENWKNNGQKGLFAMATGTGKTITSLNCLLEIYKRKGYYMAIILVPTITLVNQWEKECRKFGFNHIIKVCAKNTEWRETIADLKFRIKRTSDANNMSFIIISTYASFAKDSIFKQLNSFSKSQVMLIADEAHNMGANNVLKKLGEIVYCRRIGLSATPERQFDELTNKKLYHFFGADEKFTYEYSMKDAIKNDVLCHYLYFPHLVELTEAEMNKYEELSAKISKYFNYSKQAFEKKDEILTSLLLARKRIIHKAENKLIAFKKIMIERYEEQGSLKYSLVYVPEGNKAYDEEADIFDKAESIEGDSDSEHLIDIYTKAIADIDPRITVKKFISESKDRDSMIESFATGNLQVLSSMKCLDEGVDVPRSELAIFCSSTGNPRQFIQRRGRVLRTHPDKKGAILHDLVVIPRINRNSTSFKMEQSLLKSELKRVCNFALLSDNSSYSQKELMRVLNYYGLNLFNNDHI